MCEVHLVSCLAIIDYAYNLYHSEAFVLPAMKRYEFHYDVSIENLKFLVQRRVDSARDNRFI